MTAAGGSVFSWELIDRVIAVVNDTPIIESEVLGKFKRLQNFKKISKNKYSFEISRILDRFIEDVIVEQIANEESIIVSDKKVDNQIEKIMKQLNISSMQEFKNNVESKEKISFEEYREELKISIMREQVISIAIGISPPSRSEALEWYKKNKEKVGYQFNIRQILIRLKDRSIAEERRVNDLIKGLRDRIMAGESFESVARSYSEDASAKKGGDMGWVNLAEIDPYLATQIFYLKRPGQISQVIKSAYGYHLVKMLDRRVMPFEEIQEKIYYLLYQQKMATQYQKWITQKKRESEIRIYMDDYVRG